MKKLSEIFAQPDERIWLIAEEDFILERTGYVLNYDDMEELDLAFELPTPELEEVPLPGQWPAGKLPFQDQSMAWGGLSLALKSIAECLQVAVQAYEHSSYDADGKKVAPAFSFVFQTTDAGYQEGRI